MFIALFEEHPDMQGGKFPAPLLTNFDCPYPEEVCFWPTIFSSPFRAP
jgi:hypothetical protein